MHIVDHLSHELGAESGEPNPCPPGCTCVWNDLDFGWVKGADKPTCPVHGTRSSAMPNLTPEHAAQLSRNLIAVNDELDQMIIYWRIACTPKCTADGLHTFAEATLHGEPTPDDLLRLLTVAVARLAAQ